MNAATHQHHISRTLPLQSHMRTILRAPSCWSSEYPRPETETGRPSELPRVPYRGRRSWSVRRPLRRTRNGIDMTVCCWPRERGLAGEVEAGIRCAAPFWRRRRGPGPVSTAITASCYRGRARSITRRCGRPQTRWRANKEAESEEGSGWSCIRRRRRQ